MAEKHSISVLGCGWLGLPLAAELVQLGYPVKGSTTQPNKLASLAAAGISPYQVLLTPERVLYQSSDFFDADILILAFPAGIRKGNTQQYLQQLVQLVRVIEQHFTQKILFISTTGAYPDLNQTFTGTEDLKGYRENNPYLQAEAMVAQVSPAGTTIVRMGGLVGADRHPGRFLAGKSGVPNPEAPVNLIHRQDCLGVLTGIIHQELWGQVYNACADHHPTRRAFYTAAAQALGLPAPGFTNDAGTAGGKVINSDRLKQDLGYTFTFPDPMQFF